MAVKKHRRCHSIHGVGVDSMCVSMDVFVGILRRNVFESLKRHKADNAQYCLNPV